MSAIISILHTPGASPSQVMSAFLRLKEFLGQIELSCTDLRIYTQARLGLTEIENEKWVKTLILGWHAVKKPDLTKWHEMILGSQMVSQFIPLDLIDKDMPRQQSSGFTRDNSGDWSSKAQRTKLKLFLKGFYLNAFAPYGLMLLPRDQSPKNNQPYRSCNTLGHGPKEDVDIVRMIFSLFVDYDYSFTDISNLLIAQKINPPRNISSWTPRALKGILKSAVYIGVNQFRGCIKHDVVTPLIDRAMFFSAQRKIYQNQIPSVSIET